MGCALKMYIVGLPTIRQKLFYFRELKYKEVSLYTDVSSFQGIGIEGFTVYRGVLISGSWNKGVPLYTEMSSLQGVGIEEFHCIQRCPHFRGLE